MHIKRNLFIATAIFAMIFTLFSCNTDVPAPETEYTITYELNGGTNDEGNPAKYKAEDLPLTLKAPTREDYTFDGWYATEDFSGEAVTEIAKGATGDKTFYAKWTAVEYTITYVLNDGTNDAGNPAKYTAEDLPLTLKAPTREGYTFDVWYATKDFSGESVTEIAKGATGNKTFYAKWTKIASGTGESGNTGGGNAGVGGGNTDTGDNGEGGNTGDSGNAGTTPPPAPTEYTITYELNSGMNDSANPVKYTAENAVTLADPTREGYTFGGWFVASDFSGDAVTQIAAGSTGNKTFYAKWTIAEYSITYVLDYGTNNAENPATYTVESGKIILADPTREGYVFIGWYATENFSGEAIKEIAKGSTGNKTFYAKLAEGITIEEATAESKTFETNQTIKIAGPMADWQIEGLKDKIKGLSGITLDLSGTTGLTSIGEEAFKEYTGLKSITIPDSVTSIGDFAFMFCSKLTSVTIPDSVTKIGQYAFCGCSLTSVVIPDSVIEIGEGAFSGCTLTSVVIPDSVTSIGDYVFNCTELTSVTIPDSVTSIGNSAFDSTRLTSVVIPDSVTSIGDNAFHYCVGLTSVTIGNSVTEIGKEAFKACTGLKSVVIPDSVTSIGYAAFKECVELTSVTIPDSASIGIAAFNGCTGLKRVDSSSIEDWCRISFGSVDSNPLFYAKHLYIDGTEITELVIPDSVTSINSNAFYGCTGLTSVTIGNSVTSIGYYAFSSCTGLKSVTIGNSVTSINSNAFSSCTRLTSVTIQAENPPHLNGSAFDNNASGRKIYVPEGSVDAYKEALGWSLKNDILKIGE